MKKLLIIPVAALSLSLSLAGCSSKKIPENLQGKVDPSNISNLPSWVLNPDIKDGVAAVGIAGPSRGGIRFQTPKAETDARANIATVLQSEISRVTKTALREAQVNDINDVEEVFSQATKEVVKNIPLSGVKRLNIHQGQDGNLYIHMALKAGDYSKYIENSQKIYEQRLKKANLSRQNMDKAQEAVKGLFDELEKERKN